jgi:hypothetical protein
MTMHSDPLDRLLPPAHWQADWADVVGRAGVTRRRVRRLVVALVVVAAVLVPLAALAAANDWWFLRGTGAPRPVHEPFVIRDGRWDGHGWQLVAYPSATDGLCLSMTPTGSSEGAAMSCGPFAGVGRTRETKATPDMRITFLSGGGSELLPAYITGPVIETATTVEIRLTDGSTLRAPTFAARAPLAHVRFYVLRDPDPTGSAPQWVAGLDASGKIVACLVPKTATDGISPLSACR